MSAWMPRTLFGRMMSILLLGLLMAQALNRSIHQFQHHKSAIESGQMQAAQRVADLISLMSALTPETKQAIAAQYDNPLLHIYVPRHSSSVHRIHERYNPRIKVFRNTLHELLNKHPPASIAITEIAPQNLLLNVQLRDGTLLEMASDLSYLGEEEPTLWLHHLIVLVVISAFSYVAVHWVSRPLLALANAAEELGRDIHIPPLDEKDGPIEVIRATRAFNRMQSHLVRHIKDRTQLLAAISHDLKTPITRLRLRTEFLDDSAIQTRFKKDLDDMENMVMLTLDFMRGVDQQEDWQTVDMMTLLESIQADAQEVGGVLMLHGSMQSPYQGKPGALKRCIGNLVDNALKYGHSAELFVEDGVEFCTIRILDQGGGIPDHQLQQVFIPYYRLESSRNRDTGGSGLGLSIAQDIVQIHGGGLSLNNGPSGGLEVVLSLPRIQRF
jgi:signal transduction histidine kinase